MNVALVYGIRVAPTSGKAKGSYEKIAAFNDNANCRVFTIEQRVTNSILCSIFAEISFAVAVLKGYRPNVIYARSFFCLCVLAVAKCINAKIIFDIHADLSDESRILYRPYSISALASRILNILMLFVYYRADGLVFNTIELADYYQKERGFEKKPVFVSNNGCDSKKDPAPTEDVWLPLDGHKISFVFVGSISPWHGVEKLVYFISELQRLQNDFSLTLTIVGPKRRSLNDLVNRLSLQNVINFAGEVTSEISDQIILDHDYCVVTSGFERVSPGSPLKLYDYVRCGRPVLAQAGFSCYGDLVESLDIGYALNFESPPKAAAQFLSNIQFHKFSSIGLKHIARSNFDWSIRVTALLKFFDTISRS